MSNLFDKLTKSRAGSVPTSIYEEKEAQERTCVSALLATNTGAKSEHTGPPYNIKPLKRTFPPGLSLWTFSPSYAIIKPSQKGA